MVHVKMVTPTLAVNALILTSVTLFARTQMIPTKSAINAPKAPFVQIMLAATHAQDDGLTDR